MDTPLEDYKNASVNDFDFWIFEKSCNLSGDKSGTSTLYNYSSQVFSWTGNEICNVDLTPYDGKKITAIGFAGVYMFRDVKGVYEIYACLDTSNYAITIDADKPLNITRKDNISSNAICDGYNYPLHLAPILELKEIPTTKEDDYEDRYLRSILYSVGFGSKVGQMQQEFKIGDEAEIETIDDFTYGVVMKNPVEVPIYPKTALQPSVSKYPLEPKYTMTIYPQETALQPVATKYPMKTGYTYIIFKYRLYYAESPLLDPTYLDEYYTMSYQYTPKGVFTVTNTIERKE